MSSLAKNRQMTLAAWRKLNPGATGSDIKEFKLAFGKVENTGLPDGVQALVPKPEDISILDPGTLNYQDAQMITTTQPSWLDADGQLTNKDGTECYISGAMKRKIVAAGLIPPVPVPSKTIYRISSSPNKGLCMFAKTDIPAGELIVAERPLVIFPGRIMTERRDEIPEHLTFQQMQQVMLNDAEILYTRVVDRLDPQRKAAFMKLANSHLHDGSGPIVGRVRTNGFGRLTDPGSIGEYTIIGDNLSRMNHSCSPNVHCDFDMHTFSLTARAVREIKKGEEITVHYCHILEPAETRQESLAPYGFKCECKACLDPRSSDLVRAKCAAYTSRANSEGLWYFDESIPKAPSFASLLAALRVFTEEGLEVCDAYGYVLYQLLKAYLATNDFENVKIYLDKYRAWAQATGNEETATKKVIHAWNLGRMVLQLRVLGLAVVLAAKRMPKKTGAAKKTAK
ncbi:hypothetical protein EUX98_g6551 [Antrodiella citrinella]|uniref:Uncharacterized protein n=1 Tax=Antrodiella citrinella TaxID=2447956 RepID=A0A4S4MP15_9APHY|nr:hypothetical protein EUX98_g6551 [Antrodiella citrinella]